MKPSDDTVTVRWNQRWDALARKHVPERDEDLYKLLMEYVWDPCDETLQIFGEYVHEHYPGKKLRMLHVHEAMTYYATRMEVFGDRFDDEDEEDDE